MVFADQDGEDRAGLLQAKDREVRHLVPLREKREVLKVKKFTRVP